MILSKEQKGSFYAILSGLLYGLIGYFGMSMINAGHSVANMLFWRFFFASIFVAIILVYQGKKIHLSWSLIFISIFYASCSVLYFIACEYIGSGLAMVIFFVYPIIIILFNWLFYQHKISKIYFISVFLLLAGLLTLIHNDEVALDLYGIAFALLSAATYAAYIIYSKRQISLPPLESTFAVSFGSGILCLLIALGENSLMLPTTISVWLDAIGIAIICTILPILLLLEGLKFISAEKTAILSVLEPVCVVIIGAWLLKEQISISQAFAIVTILSSALIAARSEQ